MAGMTHEYSNFPNEIYKPNKFKDVDDSIANLINEIKSLQHQGLYDQANRVVEKNKDVLKQYRFNSETFNHIEEETRNLEIYAKQAQQSIYVQDEEPESAILGDVWIGG